MSESTIQRSLYYYDLYASYTDIVSKSPIHSYQYISDFLSDLYNQQSQTTNFKRYAQVTRNNNNFFVIVDTVEESYIEFRIVLCRLDALPFIEKNGALEQLGDYIDADQNIAEITHCVYFPKYGVMGAEYNFSGCRPTTIAEYIMLSKNNSHFISCQAKLNFDAYNKVIANKEYSLFDFAVKSNSDAYNKVLAQKSIFKAIREDVPDADTIEVVLKKRKTSKNKFSGFTPPLALEEIMELLKNYRDDIKRFNVSQDTFSEKVDLLSDKLVTKVTMVRTNKRTIDSDAMYKEIRRFFNSTVIKYCKE